MIILIRPTKGPEIIPINVGGKFCKVEFSNNPKLCNKHFPVVHVLCVSIRNFLKIQFYFEIRPFLSLENHATLLTGLKIRFWSKSFQRKLGRRSQLQNVEEVKVASSRELANKAEATSSPSLLWKSSSLSLVLVVHHSRWT